MAIEQGVHDSAAPREADEVRLPRRRARLDELGDQVRGFVEQTGARRLLRPKPGRSGARQWKRSASLAKWVRHISPLAPAPWRKTTAGESGVPDSWTNQALPFAAPVTAEPPGRRPARCGSPARPISGVGRQPRASAARSTTASIARPGSTSGAKKTTSTTADETEAKATSGVHRREGSSPTAGSAATR